MAAPPPTISLDTLITLKVNHNGSAKRFKLPLRDLTMQSLEDKVSSTLLCAYDFRTDEGGHHLVHVVSASAFHPYQPTSHYR